MQTSLPVEEVTAMLDIFLEDLAEDYLGFMMLDAEAACAVLYAHFMTCYPVVRKQTAVAEEAIKQFEGGSSTPNQRASQPRVNVSRL